MVLGNVRTASSKDIFLVDLKAFKEQGLKGVPIHPKFIKLLYLCLA